MQSSVLLRRRLLLFRSCEWHSGVALWQEINRGMIFRGRNGQKCQRARPSVITET